MSLLSQFFPSGGSGTKVDFLLVAGGGGGGASGGYTACACQSVGGGGGGGMVVLGEDYEVVPGQTYPIVIGAGGAGGGFYYNLTIQNQNYKMGGSLRGANGGDSFFGSVRAIGGGGGGAGNTKKNCLNYLCTELSNDGKIGGNGGGAGSVCNTCFQVGTTSAGNAVGAYPVGNTIKFGSPGSSSPTSYPSSWQQLFTGYANCSYQSAGGGGGAGLGGGAFTGGTLVLTTPFDGNFTCAITSVFTTVACSTYDCHRTWIPNEWSGTLGGRESGNTYEQFRTTDATNILAGKDGYLSNMSGSDEYYGGGGAVAYSVTELNSYALGLVMAPDHLCYPTNSSCAHLVCPYGGLGGGTYFASNQACASNPYFLSSLKFSCLGFTYGCSVSPLGMAVCGGAAGTGGGGGAHMLQPLTPTGPVYPNTPNTCAYCGTNGASGSLIIRYPTAFAEATVTGNTPTPAQPGYRVYKWTGPGTITFA